MKIITSCVLSALALSSVTGVSAAEAEKANVTRTFTDIVEPAEQQAYEAAVKTYNQCLGQQKSKYKWLAWGHETGNTYMYSYAAGPYAWSDFDAMHEIGKTCDITWRKEANPHLKSETSAFLIEMPDLSYTPKDFKDKDAKPALINVTFFNLKSTHEADGAFTDGIRKIVAAAEKSGWKGHYTFYRIRSGDKDAPDYLILSPYKNWAAYGAGADPGVWKMVENVYGKQEGDALHKSIDDSLQDVSSHVDSYNEELTYAPSGK